MDLIKSWDNKQKLHMLPQTLEECFESIKNDFADYHKITKHSEKEISSLHMSAGMWIRNNYGLWNPEKTKLVEWFNENGIYHADDMSSIILKSFHRHLNNKDLNLDEQFNHYIKWWEKQGIDLSNQKTF